MNALKHLPIVALCLGLIAVDAGGQSPVALAGRAGTLGWGGELAVALGPDAALRGGVGVSTLDADTRFGDFAARLELPSTWYDVGLEWYPVGTFRLSTGVLFQGENPLIVGVVDRPIELGGQTVTPAELGALTGIVRTRDRIPFFKVGFGRHNEAGFGLFLDLGLGLLGSPTVELNADGGSLDPGALRGLLDAEAAAIEDDLKTYLRLWPIMSVGLRYGIGGRTGNSSS